MTETVYIDRDNVSTVLFKSNDVAIDFSAATRFLLILDATVIDSNVLPSVITTTLTLGQIQFKLGDVAIPAGTYNVKFIVYDGLHPNGQVILCEEDGQILTFIVKAC